MKKLFVLFISLFFIGCGLDNNDDDSETNPLENPVSPPIEECQYCIPIGAIFSCREIREALDFLNFTVRAEVGVSPLQWDCQLAQKAQDWAEYLAENGFFQHEPDSPYGENLFIAGGYIPTLKKAIEDWYSEKQFFVYGLENWCSEGECLHYTQLIWSSTQKIGCGIAKYKKPYQNFEYVIVCKFAPPGNIIGQQPY